MGAFRSRLARRPALLGPLDNLALGALHIPRQHRVRLLPAQGADLGIAQFGVAELGQLAVPVGREGQVRAQAGGPDDRLDLLPA